MDEFDNLLVANNKVRESLLNWIRIMKQNAGKHQLHSVVGIGSHSILELCNYQLENPTSPFNATDTFLETHFTRKQVRALLEEYVDEYQIKLPDFEDFVNNVFETTKG